MGVGHGVLTGPVPRPQVLAEERAGRGCAVAVRRRPAEARRGMMWDKRLKSTRSRRPPWTAHGRTKFIYAGIADLP